MSERVITLEGLADARARPAPLAREAHPNALLWLQGQLIGLDELPDLTRLEAWYFYRYRRQPRANVFYDIRGSYPSRAWAHSMIEPGDPLGYVVAVPFGRSLGAEVSESPYFCRPYWPGHFERNREHALLYADDLRDLWHGEVAAKTRELVHVLEGVAERVKGHSP